MTGTDILQVCVLSGDPRLPDETKRDSRYNEEDLATNRAMREALATLPGYRFEHFDDHGRLLERFDESRADLPDLVMNLCDTGFRNVATRELHVPALLELLGVPYTGAGPAAMVTCYDKEVVRLLAGEHGVPVPREAYIAADADLDDLPDLYPALIKPNQADGSVGITKDARVETQDQARAYLTWLREALPGRAALMQEYLPGPEYGIGLIGNPEGGLRALPPLEVDFSRLPAGLTPILSYESKAMPDTPYWTDIRFRQADLDSARAEQLADWARILFARLGLRDYGRFDFRCAADGTPRLMEVNPNPAWANDGKLAFMAGFVGIAYADMLGMILDAARTRIGR